MQALPRLFRSLTLAALASAVLSAPADAQVIISEFMATNVNTNITDEDGSRADWIELQNNGDTAVSLNGWYLTDDARDLRKWQFPQSTPAVSLAPGARLLVWASGKNRKLAMNRLHTNFRLDGGGEYLALVRPDGLTPESHFAPVFPPQATDVSYGVSGGRQWNVLLGPSRSTQWKVRVPQDANEFTGTMAGWNTSATFDANAWATKGTVLLGGVPKGIGYDSGGSNGARGFLVNYSGSPNGNVAANTDVGATTVGMYISSSNANYASFAGAPTLCARTTFNVADPAAVQQLRLNARYDDGFIVYLNGTEIYRTNAPATPAWNSTALTDREDDLSEEDQTIPLPGAQQHLVAGPNLLAIHGFNHLRNSGHFLITPSLEAFQTVNDATGGTIGYLATATPGGENTVASTAIGPDISQTTKNPSQPVGGSGSAPLLVTTRVRPTLNPVASVTCRYVINFGSEITLTMRDDATGGDVTAGDGIYSVQLPTNGLAQGHLLRWRIVATDNASPANQATDPPYRDPYDNDQYFGTMAQTPAIQSRLPVLYWFHNSSSTTVFATTEGGFRSAIFFKLPTEGSGRFYDNVRLNLHGQSTSSFGKKSQNLNFNADNRFKWRAGEKEIRAMNLLSNWADKTHVRNSLAWETWNLTGHPSHWCQTVRVQQITAGNLSAGVDAQFLCLTDMTEDGNEEFLERWGLDPVGALYKCYNSLENTLQNSSTQAGGVEKKTREFEDFSDLQTLVSAMSTSNSVSARRQWLYDNVDVPALINYIAVHNLISSHDYGHKNYYIYRDTLGSGEWMLLPWDQDLSFGHRWTSAQNYFDDDLESASSIMLGGGGNRLMNIINSSGATELTQMYVRRLRTLADQFYGPPAAPLPHFESRIDSFLDLFDPPAWPVTTDAERDFQKWGFWVDGSNAVIPASDSRAVHHRIRPSAVRIKSANDTTIYPGANPYTPYGSTMNLHSSMNPYLPGRRSFLYNQISGATPSLQGQTIPAAQPATPNLIIDNINFNPGAAGQDGEFLIIRNPNAFAVDISGWKLAGAVDFTFKAGTVIPAQGTSTSDGASAAHVNQLVIARKPAAVRNRAASPRKNEYRLVTGGYSGQLSARGETIELRDAGGVLIRSASYAGSPTAAQQALRVAELNFAPAAPTASESAALPGLKAGDFEFIELTNIGSAPLNLSGARFTEGVSFTFPAGFTLAPGARTLVVSHTAAFAQRYGSDLSVAGQWEGNLDNGGEELEIVDAAGEVVLDFRYQPAWYPPANGGGYSLVTRSATPDFQGYDQATQWALSAQPRGTPGAADTGFSEVFEGWRHDFFSAAEGNEPTIGSTAADPDGDGRSNLAEYVFATHPRQPDRDSSATSMISLGGVDYLTITFTRRKAAIDLAYAVEVSADLAEPNGWTVVNLPVGAPQDLGNGMERVTYRDSQPATGTPRFIRVRATR